MWWHGNMHFGWMVFFWLAFIAAAAIGLRHALGGMGSINGPEDSPESILKRRYAKGEIDRDDYERRLADLRK